ncbi:hypothetical protein BC829DRAFT_439576 [Chytridium lagenaria]|nr:hypothetical protein BC829DRAFT_439576 [Chytridium lagenaria]
MINLLLQAAGIVGFNIPILSGSPSPTHVSPKPTATIRKDYSRFLPGFAEPVSPVSLGDGLRARSKSPSRLKVTHEAEAADVDQQVSESELVETKSETVVESKYARLGRLLLEPMAEDFYKSDDEDGFYGSDDYFKNAQIKPPSQDHRPTPSEKGRQELFPEK